MNIDPIDKNKNYSSDNNFKQKYRKNENIIPYSFLSDLNEMVDGEFNEIEFNNFLDYLKNNNLKIKHK